MFYDNRLIIVVSREKEVSALRKSLERVEILIPTILKAGPSSAFFAARGALGNAGSWIRRGEEKECL